MADRGAQTAVESFVQRLPARRLLYVAAESCLERLHLPFAHRPLGLGRFQEVLDGNEDFPAPRVVAHRRAVGFVEKTVQRDAAVIKSTTGPISLAATGDILLTRVASDSGDISLTSATAILDNLASDDPLLLTAGHLTLSSVNGIGADAGSTGVAASAAIEDELAALALEIAVASLTVENAGVGDVVIIEQDNLDLVSANNPGGYLVIILLQGDLRSGSLVGETIQIVVPRGSAQLDGDLGAGSGGISVEAEQVQQASPIHALGDVTLTATRGDLVMTEESSTTSQGRIDYHAEGDLLVGMLEADSSIQASAGGRINAITDGTALRTPGRLDLGAGQGIGEQMTIKVEVGEVSANSRAGDIRLHGISGQVFATNGVTAQKGSVDLTSDGDMVIGGPVTAGTGIGLQALAGTLTIEDNLIAGDAITMAADSITQEADVSAVSDITATARIGAITMADGSETRTTRGDIRYQALDDIEVSILSAPRGDVQLTSLSGSIQDNLSGEAFNLVAGGTVLLDANHDIGSGTNDGDIDFTSAAILVTDNGAGLVYLENELGQTISGTKALAPNGANEQLIDDDLTRVLAQRLLEAKGKAMLEEGEAIKEEQAKQAETELLQALGLVMEEVEQGSATKSVAVVVFSTKDDRAAFMLFEYRHQRQVQQILGHGQAAQAKTYESILGASVLAADLLSTELTNESISEFLRDRNEELNWLAVRILVIAGIR